ncbi:MAG: hypothetical protein H0V43_08605 [Gemmatimonadales bacterium]|nr:hypothetical protein [Gemmatimonadales bacterium]
MPLTTSLNVRLSATLTKTIDLITAGLTAPLAVNDTLSLATGTASGLADIVFWDTRTLAASATENIDLAGVLVDAFGATLTFVKVKMLYVRAAAANNAANNVVVGGAAANGFFGPFNAATDKVSLAAGDIFLATKTATGWTVTAATGDILLIANSAGTNAVTYDIVVVGTSA